MMQHGGQGGNQVLDEREEENEDGGAFVLEEEDKVDTGAEEGGLGILRSGSRWFVDGEKTSLWK